MTLLLGWTAGLGTLWNEDRGQVDGVVIGLRIGKLGLFPLLEILLETH